MSTAPQTPSRTRTTGTPDARRGRDLVVLLDGTSNHVEADLSNVLKLYRMLERDPGQLVHYSPGVGTIGLESSWGRTKQGFNTILGLATGWGLDANILGAYRFLCTNHLPEDRIHLLGFSRGAYTARAVAGLIHLLGLIHPEQLNLAEHALTAYKRASQDASLSVAWHFRRVVGGRRAPIHFLGLWDTVASVIVPRRDRLYLPSLEHLAHTKRNPSVARIRHACAIDERRRMFRPLHWPGGEPFQPDPFGEVIAEQDVRTVWFAGDHSDVGGGHPEAESGPAKFPLTWLAREAEAAGVRLREPMLRHLALGEPLPAGRHMYVNPNARAPLHAMTAAWKPLEWMPKRGKWRRHPPGAKRSGWYLPRSEPRLIEDGALVHRSVAERIELTGYAPGNLPVRYEVVEDAAQGSPVRARS